jgi:hypothetical protein
VVNSRLLGSLSGRSVGNRPGRRTVPELRSRLMVNVEIVIDLKAYSPWPCCGFLGHIDQGSIILINIAMQDYIPFASRLHHTLSQPSPNIAAQP